MGLKAKFSTGRWARRTCRTVALWLEFTRTVSVAAETALCAEEVLCGREEAGGVTAEAAGVAKAGGRIGPEEAVCGRDAGGRIGPEERDDCGASGVETM